MLPARTAAEDNILLTQQLVREIQRDFLQIGRLLSENQDNAYWSQCGHESFRDYVESLGAGSYSWATRIMGMARVVDQGLLTEAEAMEIGVAKLALLLPSAESGFSEDIKALAKVAPLRDFKQALGHKVTEVDPETSIDCPRCSFKILGAMWVRKDA